MSVNIMLTSDGGRILFDSSDALNHIISKCYAVLAY